MPSDVLRNRALVLRTAGGHLEWDERPISRPGPAEVLVRLLATSLNRRDQSNIRGFMPGLPLPRIPCSDGCGEVVAVGPGVSEVREGDVVCANFFPNWVEGPPTPAAVRSAYGGDADGFLQEYAVVPAQALVRAPSGLSPAEAASLVCAGVTAWRSVAVEGALQPGEVVVIEGTGGVSLFALGFAKLMGARVILLSSSDEKLRRGAELGADELINYRESPEWHPRVRELTNGRGADLVVEVGGAPTFPQAIKSLRMGGRISVVGILAREPAVVELPWIISNHLQVRGVMVGSRRHFEDMNRFIDANGFRPTIDRTFPVSEANAAFEYQATNAHFGKVAIEIAQR
jgi:NADPH:quinone reductase-like Zn-dependent oxidoreductase